MKLLILLLLGLIVWVALIGMIYWKETHLPSTDSFDALVVLGCRVMPDRSLSVQLRLRLEKAYDVWAERHCPIVVCGGQGSDEPDAEARVMRQWLLDHGVPDEQILCDDVSSNTRQNLQNAANLLGNTDELTIAIVSSDYHVPRASSLAKDLGLKAVGFGAETFGGFYWIKNRSKEALSWVKYWTEKYILRH